MVTCLPQQGLRSNAKRPSPQRAGESLVNHRGNRTAHEYDKSHPARSSQAHSGPTSHQLRYVMERDAELRKSQDETGDEMLGAQNTPPQKSEAGSLAKNLGGSCIGTSNKRDSIARKTRRNKVPIHSISYLARRSSIFFRVNCPPVLSICDEIRGYDQKLGSARFSLPSE